jgi:hypothetical protein
MSIHFSGVSSQPVQFGRRRARVAVASVVSALTLGGIITGAVVAEQNRNSKPTRIERLAAMATDQDRVTFIQKNYDHGEKYDIYEIIEADVLPIKRAS